MNAAAAVPARLAEAVAAADARLVALDRETAPTPVASAPFTMSAAVDLDRGRWLAVVVDTAGRRWSVPIVETGVGIRRARAGDGCAEALVTLLATGSATAGVEVRRWRSRTVVGEQQISVDQTNESVIVGEDASEGGAAVVKWLVHQPPVGQAFEQPAGRRLALLAETGFGGTPALWGLLTLDVGERSPLLLASVVEHVPHAEDGWTWVVEDVRKVVSGSMSMADSLAVATDLGSLTARLHLAFAAGGIDQASADDTRRWAAQAQADLDLAVASVGGPEGVRLRELAPQAARAMAGLSTIAGTPLIDVHGDLHVGQVLRHGLPPGHLVVDFDGSPVVAEEIRAARQPAAVDVAGMLASLDHVGRVVLKRTEGVDTPLVEHWIDGARQSFLAGYRSELAGSGQHELLDDRLLRPLLVAQEIREYLYAVRHLPHWTYVPDQALPELLKEG